MSLLTVVIDDKSPLISYDDTWLPGTSQDDNYAVDYYLGTFQKNSATDGTATISFNATSIWIYGANRPNHGLYTVQVDGNSYPSVNGSGNNLFQQTLFNTNVSQGMHTVDLVNTGGSSSLYVDIDMIVWQSEVGSPGQQLALELVADMDSRFQYKEQTWLTTSSNSYLNLNLFNNGTGHVTETYDATVTFTFTGTLVLILSERFGLTTPTGEAVTLYGTAGPANGPYSVQLDDAEAVSYNATNAYPTSYGVVIYHADNLGSGSHQLVLTNLPATTEQQYLTIDYAQLWTVTNGSSTSATAPLGATTCPSLSGSNDIAQNLNGVSSGAIAGLVVEGVVAILAAAIALLFYRRWRRAEMTLKAPQAFYTQSYRSPESTGMATVMGIAPSLETGSNPSSRRKGALQPPATAQSGALSHAPASSAESRTESDVTGSRGPLSNEAPGRKALPGPAGSSRPTATQNAAGLPSGQGGAAFGSTNEHPPPNYDTAMRSRT